MNNKSTIRMNYLYNVIYQIANILVPIITTPYLTRVLHARGMGRFAFYYSVSNYFCIFIKLGLLNYGNRTIAMVKDDKKALSNNFWAIYSFQLFMGLLVLSIYFLYCLLVAKDRRLAWVFSLMVLSAIIELDWLLYGLEKFKLASIRDAIVKVITAAGIMIFVKNAEDIWKYALIYALGVTLCQVITLPKAMKYVGFVRVSKKEIISHIRPNLLLFLPTIAISIYKTMDKIMLGKLSTDVELGYYHSCEGVIQVPLALITALGTIMLPRMSNMIVDKARKDEVDSLFMKSIEFAVFVTTSICFGIMAVAKEFVPLFYGKGFEKCISIFYIILPSCIFVAFANVLRTQYLLPRKRDSVYVVSLFLGALINLIVNMLLIPRMGSLGAAIGTLATEIIVCLLQARVVYKETNLSKHLIDTIPYFLSGIVMFTVIVNIKNKASILWLFSKIFLGFIIYIFVLSIAFFTRRILNEKHIC